MSIDEELASEELADCPECGACNAPMGTLGFTIHYSCRMCGWAYSEDNDDEQAAA